MKNIILLFSLLILAMTFSCEDEIGPIDTSPECIRFSQNNDWLIEDFKSNYTIQFPSTYEGVGMIGFEGKIFSKHRSNRMMEFSYAYLTSTYSNPFGAKLENPIPNEIEIKMDNQVLNLDKKVEFCNSNDDVVGILFHNSNVQSTGKYYFLLSDGFFEGLTIVFPNTDFDEVIDIISTIKEK